MEWLGPMAAQPSDLQDAQRGGADRAAVGDFDIDKSRSIPPQRRPEASRLLAALANPNRGFEAVVVGEPQRAF